MTGAQRGDNARDAIKAKFRSALDDLDQETRLPGEQPLRQAVAEQARERLAEMDGDCRMHWPDGYETVCASCRGAL